MYFTRSNRGIYHVLHYTNSGTVPPPCGARPDRLDLMDFKEGRHTPNIVAEVPAGALLCKSCEAGTLKRGYVAAE